MKLGHKQRQLFEHAFLCGLNAAGTITRAQVDEAMQRAVSELEATRKRCMGDKAAKLLNLFDKNGIVVTSDIVKQFGGHVRLSNAYFILKRRGLIENVSWGVWRRTPNGEGRAENALGGLNERV